MVLTREGRYVSQVIDIDDERKQEALELRADEGQLRVTNESGATTSRLAFYRKDCVLVLHPDGRPTGCRAEFVRGADGLVAWRRNGGRLRRHQR